ncbi:MAG: AraC family transcriptional regulator ligand-binding domain-containing protein, partial [Verrucomicrobiae bacterium]|nr:AraC family transcriptional regulator ligand-binding domain-containing protein [Verrucomicrobiae bacterium]
MLNQLLINSEATRLVLAFLDTLPRDELTDSLRNLIEHCSRSPHVSFEAWWALLEAVQKQVSVPALGLKIGECVKVEHLGCLGYLLKTSRDLEQALKSFERFQRLLYDGNRADLIFEESPDSGRVGTLIWQADFGHSSQMSDELLLSGLIALTRSILPPPSHSNLVLHPLRVHFTNPVPRHLINYYETYFQCPVRFSQPNLLIRFPAELFSLPIQGSDEHLHALISNQAESLLVQAPNAEAEHPFLIQLRKTLVRALQEGDPTADYVARNLHMSSRTLHRKLN